MLRRSFAETVLADWRTVLAFAGRQGILDTASAAALAAALEEVDPADVRSELIHQYFLALEGINAKDRAGAARAARTLGNVLLPLVAAGDVDVPVPVAEADGLVLPAAHPDARVAMPTVGGVAAVEEVRARREEIEAHVEASWVRRAGHGSVGVGVRGLTTPIAFEVQKYDERTSMLAGSPAGLRVLEIGTRDGAAVLDGIQQAMELIDSVDPGLAAEIAAVTEYVVLLDGLQFVGGSDIFLFGATFLRLDHRWTSLCFADHLVHEAAHQVLHVSQELDPLLLNREQMGQPSPIRSDARPLYGTFHATFVFLRLARFMHRMLEVGPPELAAEAEVRLHRHLLGLRQGLQILADYGELSPAGRDAVDEWMSAAAELTARVGEPDVRLYERLDWDYEPADGDLPLLPV